MQVQIDPLLLALIEDMPLSRVTIHAAISIASTIYEHANDCWSTRQSRSVEDLDAFVPLHSNILGQIYGDQVYRRAMAALRGIGAVEVNDSYLSKRSALDAGMPEDMAHCKGYRLAPRYRNAVATELDAPKLEARIDAALLTASYSAMSGKPRQWIVESYKRATFDPTAADVLAKHDFADEHAANRGRGAYQKTRDHVIRFTAGRKKSGRVFYPITALPHVLRPCLLLDGQPTVELDIAACQPSLIATLYAPDCPERATYLEFVRRPDFYEQFGRWAGKDWSREECKKEVFNQVIYGSAYCAEKYTLLPQFAKRFPLLAATMRGIKLGPGSNSALPLRMQALEASIVIDGAIGECAGLGIPVLPVHDSLICRLPDGPVVAEILGRHWVERTGIPARVKGLQLDVPVAA